MNAVRLTAALLAAATLAGAAWAQEFLGRPLDQWVSDLAPGKPAEARRSAAFAIGKIGLQRPQAVLKDSNIVAGLIGRFDDADAGVREAAVFALGEVFGKGRVFNDKVLERLCAMVQKDPDPLVRRSAAFALGSIRKPNEKVVAAALGAAAADKHPAVRQNVAWALGRLGDESIKPLCRLLKDEDVLVKRDAAAAVQNLSSEVATDALPELLRCAEHPDVELRKAALAALVSLVSSDDADAARGVLRKGLGDAQPEIRYNAALALAQFGGDDAMTALPVLREALKPGNRLGLRRQAASAVGGLRTALNVKDGDTLKAKDDKDHIPELHAALADPDEELRRNAAIACVRLGPAGHPYVGGLVKILANRKDSKEVRAQAAVALSRIGFVPALQKSMPTLMNVVTDKTEAGLVRERTLWPVRLYLRHSKPADREPVYKALATILDEDRPKDQKMLHYDCAYLLGMFQQKKVPDKVLDVLQAFMEDTEIKLYASVGVGTQPVTEKKDDMGKKAKEVGKDDGRVMAVDALSQIGRDKVLPRNAIIAQMRALVMEATTDPVLRSKIRDLFGDWGLK